MKDDASIQGKLSCVMDVEAYLRRIGLEQAPRPDQEGLMSVQRAHRWAIPFENFDIPLGGGSALIPPPSSTSWWFDGVAAIVLSRTSSSCVRFCNWVSMRVPYSHGYGSWRKAYRRLRTLLIW